LGIVFISTLLSFSIDGINRYLSVFLLKASGVWGINVGASLAVALQTNITPLTLRGGEKYPVHPVNPV
jgi:hypothetical protein